MSTSQKHKRRSSQTLPLVLATSAAVAGLSGCGGETNNLTSVRDEYKSLEDCKEDWGSTDPCQPQPAPPNSNAIANTGNTSGGYIYSGRYWGPSYFEGQRDIAQRNVNASLTDRAIGRSITRSVSRGGFGSSSRGFSGGG
jgi:hypothetical protein